MLTVEQQAEAQRAHDEMQGSRALPAAPVDASGRLDELEGRFVNRVTQQDNALSDLEDRVTQTEKSIAEFGARLPLELVDGMRTLRAEFDAMRDYLRVFHRDMPVPRAETAAAGEAGTAGEMPSLTPAPTAVAR